MNATNETTKQDRAHEIRANGSRNRAVCMGCGGDMRRSRTYKGSPQSIRCSKCRGGNPAGPQR